MLWECIVWGLLMRKLTALHFESDLLRLRTVHSQTKKHHLTNVLHISFHFQMSSTIFFLNCKAVNNTLKPLQMCYSWGIHMHISCGCILLTFHMCDKQGFTSKFKLTKVDLNFERLSCMSSWWVFVLCTMYTVIKLLFLYHWQVGLLFSFRSLLTLNLPSHFPFLCSLFHYEFKSKSISNSEK